MLINAATSGRADHLHGLERNVIIGRKIPVILNGVLVNEPVSELQRICPKRDLPKTPQPRRIIAAKAQQQTRYGGLLVIYKHMWYKSEIMGDNEDAIVLREHSAGYLCRDLVAGHRRDANTKVAPQRIEPRARWSRVDKRVCASVIEALRFDDPQGILSPLSSGETGKSSCQGGSHANQRRLQARHR